MVTLTIDIAMRKTLLSFNDLCLGSFDLRLPTLPADIYVLDACSEALDIL